MWHPGSRLGSFLSHFQPVTVALVFSSMEWDNTALQYYIGDKKGKHLSAQHQAHVGETGVIVILIIMESFAMWILEQSHSFSQRSHTCCSLCWNTFPSSCCLRCLSLAAQQPHLRDFSASLITNPLTLAVFSWRNSALPSWCLSKL